MRKINWVRNAGGQWTSRDYPAVVILAGMVTVDGKIHEVFPSMGAAMSWVERNIQPKTHVEQP
jgi:hypothetical protein